MKVVYRVASRTELGQSIRHGLDDGGSSMHVKLGAILTGETRRAFKPERQSLINHRALGRTKLAQGGASRLGSGQARNPIQDRTGPGTADPDDCNTGPARRARQRKDRLTHRF